MWILLLLAGVLFWMVASTVKQLATSIFERVSTWLLYGVMWACFLGAGIDIIRTHNLYAPLLAMCGVLMFYATIAVLQSDTLERRYRVTVVFRYALGCFVAGIVLLIAAIINFAMWLARSSVLLVIVAITTSACSGNGDDDDTPLWIVIFGIALLIAFFLGWTSEECSRCKRVTSRSKVVGGVCDECRKRDKP